MHVCDKAKRAMPHLWKYTCLIGYLQARGSARMVKGWGFLHLCFFSPHSSFASSILPSSSTLSRAPLPLPPHAAPSPSHSTHLCILRKIDSIEPYETFSEVHHLCAGLVRGLEPPHACSLVYYTRGT